MKRARKGTDVVASVAMKERLIVEAQRLGCHRSREETVSAALEEYVRLRRREKILSVHGDLEEDD